MTLGDENVSVFTLCFSVKNVQVLVLMRQSKIQNIVLKSKYSLPPEQLNCGGMQMTTGESFMNYDISLIIF